MSAELTGNVAVVTGGAKGIGRAISLSLARDGADIVMVGRDQEALAATSREIEALGRRARSVVADITQPTEIVRLSECLNTDFGGRVDILVTCAGRRDHENKPVESLDLGQFEEVMRGNLHGTLLPMREVLPLMKARRRGKIVAISGVFGLKGHPRHSAGCASKWAVEGLVRTLALEAGPFNINVNCVCPGYVDGPRAAAGMARVAADRGVEPQEVRRQLEQATALQRLSTDEDVANAVGFLVSERSRNITGRDLVVDAGWML